MTGDYTYYGIFVVAAVIGILYVVWREGWLGPQTEARMKVLRDKAKATMEKWDQEIAAKAKETAASLPTDLQALEQRIEEAISKMSPQKDKATRIAENQALLSAGTITQAEFDAAKAAILAE